MAVPKRKTSKAKRDSRRANWKLSVPGMERDGNRIRGFFSRGLSSAPEGWGECFSCAGEFLSAQTDGECFRSPPSSSGSAEGVSVAERDGAPIENERGDGFFHPPLCMGLGCRRFPRDEADDSGENGRPEKRGKTASRPDSSRAERLEHFFRGLFS